MVRAAFMVISGSAWDAHVGQVDETAWTTREAPAQRLIRNPGIVSSPPDSATVIWPLQLCDPFTGSAMKSVQLSPGSDSESCAASGLRCRTSSVWNLFRGDVSNSLIIKLPSCWENLPLFHEEIFLLWMLSNVNTSSWFVFDVFCETWEMLLREVLKVW